MTVEDLLTYMLQQQYDFKFNPWELSFVRGVGLHSMRGRALSTKQGETVVRIGKKYRKTLFPEGSADQHRLDLLILNPVYAEEPFVSEIYPREVRYAGDNLLAFRFKMNETVVRDIKAVRREFGHVFFAYKPKVWIVPVVVSNVDNVQQIIAIHDFDYDDPVLTLLAEVASSRGVAPQAIYDLEGDQIVLATTDDDMLSWFAENILKGTPV